MDIKNIEPWRTIQDKLKLTKRGPSFVMLLPKKSKESREQPIRVNSPLIKYIHPEPMYNVVANQSELDLPDHDTFFYCCNADKVSSKELPASYAEGSEEVGVFILFPSEANDFRLLLTNHSSIRWETSKIQEVFIKMSDIQNSARITHEKYLLITPELWDQIKKSRSRKEAIAILEQDNITEEKIKDEVLKRLQELRKTRTEMHKESHQFILNSTESDWMTFYNKYISPQATYGDDKGYVEMVNKEFAIIKKIAQRYTSDNNEFITNYTINILSMRPLSIATQIAQELSQINEIKTKLLSK